MSRLVSLALVTIAVVVSAEATSHQITRFSLPQQHTTFTTIPAADVNVPISGKVKRTQAKKEMLGALRNSGGQTAVVAGSDFDEEYLVNATVGGQKFSLIMDTGSSDTWLAAVGFTCINLASQVQPESECAFGPLFNPSASSSFKALPNLNFNITYGDGEFLLGNVANESITVGGLTVPNQEIGVVNRAAWFGDGVNSGLLGLAYPLLTSVYTGDESQAANDEFLVNNVDYPPFFFSAVADGRVSAPFFSVALNRGTFDQELNDPYDPNLGFLSFGGIAPVPTTHVSTTAPIQGYNINTLLPSNSSKAVHFFYTVDVQSFSFPGSAGLHTFSNDTILDTGTTLNYVPTDVANAFAASVKPPATFDDNIGAYIIDCNAVVPVFKVTIHGTTFTVDPRDQILPIGTDSNGNVVCIMGTNDGGPNENGNIFILGDTFLHNVVATFNIQSNTVTLTQRQTY